MLKQLFKNNIIFFFAILIFINLSVTVLSQELYSYKIKTVVIDAGHGGKDPGCVSRNGVYEKDIVLSVALKIGNLIKQNYSDVKVIYTRSDDQFIELNQRAKIANKNDADLFISIHCNANPSSTPFGAETFVMGIHKSEASLEIAKRENSAILMEDNYEMKYEGFNPNSVEDYIKFSLFVNTNMMQSISFAEKVQTKLKGLGRFDRGVNQAGFLVLYQPTMPSVLIEIGFLSNSNEEQYLVKEESQQEISNSIFKAFSEYKNTMDKSMGEIIKEKHNSSTNNATESDNSINNSNSSQSTSIMDENKVIYKVQLTSSSARIPLNSEKFKGLTVKEYLNNDSYKYTTGEENDYRKILEIQKEVKQLGFNDAFIIAFKNNKRISLKEALAN